MKERARGIGGTLESKDNFVRIAWAALIESAAFDPFWAQDELTGSIVGALSSIEWPGKDECRGFDGFRGNGKPPLPVDIDRRIESAIVSMDKDGIIALAASAMVPGADLPSGGVIWVASEENGPGRTTIGPMSFPAVGFSMWAEPGEWCIFAECPSSVMASIAQKAKDAAVTGRLSAIIDEARKDGVTLLLVVEDATGRQAGEGGVAFIAGHEDAVLKI